MADFEWKSFLNDKFHALDEESKNHYIDSALRRLSDENALYGIRRDIVSLSIPFAIRIFETDMYMKFSILPEDIQRVYFRYSNTQRESRGIHNDSEILRVSLMAWMEVETGEKDWRTFENMVLDLEGDADVKEELPVDDSKSEFSELIEPASPLTPRTEMDAFESDEEPFIKQISDIPAFFNHMDNPRKRTNEVLTLV